MSTTIHGEGTLYQREKFRYENGVKIPDGTFWQAAKDVPSELLPEGTTRKRITGSGETKREAKKKLDENYAKYLAKLAGDKDEVKPKKRKTKTPDELRTVASWFEEWFEHYRGHLQPETLERQKGHIRLHVLPHLGDVALGDLTSRRHWEPWMATLKAKKKVVGGVETDEPLLSPHGLLNIYKTVHAAMETASDKLGISHHFSRRLLKPPVPDEVRTTTEVVEAGKHLKKMFKERLSPDDFRYDQFLIAFMGLRAGERLGLTLDSIVGLDGDDPKLIIRTQQSYTKDRGVYLKTQTKSKRIRVVPLKGEFVESIRRLRDRRLAFENSPDFKPDRKLARCLYLREDGSIITTRQDTKIWRDMLQEFDIPFFPQHSVRSIAATTFAEQGVPTETVGAILGHQSIGMTRYYARETEQRTRREIDDVDFFA